MTTRRIIGSRTVSALALACSLSLACSLAAQPAAAQTAGSLACNGCVSSKDIRNNGIKSRDIKDGQVKSDDLASGSVTGSKIADGSVGAADLGLNAVTGAKIANGAVGPAQLSSDAQPTGADFAVDDGFQALVRSVNTVLLTVGITAPSEGIVIASGGLYVNMNDAPGRVVCDISTNGTTSAASVVEERADAGDNFAGIALTRAFLVPANTTTLTLVCREVEGNVVAFDPHLVAWFVPQRY